MGPGDLQDVLGELKEHRHPDLLVGLGQSDDAAGYRVSDEVAIVETGDFFPPIVDDPYTYGAIAAANVREAGGVIAGGHTVVDAEPKYGLCVTGRVHPKRILTKGGLRPGQKVFLSKSLGTGVIATAAKDDACDPTVLASAIQSMLRLNRVAAEVAQAAGSTGATDITGFGLLGHTAEMVEASAAGVAFRAKDLPFLPGALALAEKGHWSGGMKRNRRHVEATFGARGQLAIDPSLPEALVNLLFESETSGGLLFAVPVENVAAVREGFEQRGEGCWEVGEVTTAPRISVA